MKKRPIYGNPAAIFSLHFPRYDHSSDLITVKYQNKTFSLCLKILQHRGTLAGCRTRWRRHLARNYNPMEITYDDKTRTLRRAKLKMVKIMARFHSRLIFKENDKRVYDDIRLCTSAGKKSQIHRVKRHPTCRNLSNANVRNRY